LKPYYQHAGITIYHGDCRQVVRELDSADVCITDPPYGVGKAGWDGYFPLDWMFEVSRIAKTIAVMPGVSNVLTLPRFIGELEYRWMLAIYISNGMTRGDFGFGNWIPCVYLRSRT
jgi:predicted RNA methylase